MTIALLSFNSCRQEDLYEQNEKKDAAKYKVYMLNKSQVTSDFALFDKVARIQSVFTERKNLNARSVQDSVLDGGIVKIDKVLVVENEGGQKTYTFPLKRTFPTSKIENLILKKDTDSTFSGVLIQYDVSEQDKDYFNKWHSVDLKSRTKIFDINKLSVGSSFAERTVQVGCFNLEYDEGNLCGGSDHHAYGELCPYSNNPSMAATPPRILSITPVPGCGNGGDGSTGSSPAQGSFSPGGGEGLTMMFDEYDLTYHNGEMTDPNFQFWYKVNQFVQAQPQNVQSLNAEYHYVFYFIHTYFKLNGGLTDANKIFVADRLQKIANWLYDTSVGTHLDYDQKLNIGIWSVKYLLENPNVTWEDFKNQFLMNPCERLKTTTDNSKFSDGISFLDGKTNAGSEFGYTLSSPTPGTSQNGTQPKILETKQGSKFVDFELHYLTFAFMHSHFEGLFSIFSPQDVIEFNKWLVWAKAWNEIPTNTPKINLKNLTYTVVTSNGNYTITFDGTDVVPLPNYTQQEIDDLTDKYIKVVKQSLTFGNSGPIYNMNKLELEFMKFMRDNLNMPGLKLFKIEDSGNTEIYLDNGNRITKSCPN